jgi:hypothetical protein
MDCFCFPFVKCNGNVCGTSAWLEELLCRVVEETDHSALDHCLVKVNNLKMEFKTPFFFKWNLKRVPMHC